MVHRNNPRIFRSSGKEDVAAGSQNQHHTRPQRRRCRQTISECRGRQQARALQVYKFRSRDPSTHVHCSSEGSSKLSRTSALTEDGKIVEMMAKSTSCLVQQEPARCWVRDCTRLACSAAGHPSRTHLFQHCLLGEEDSFTSPIREEFLPTDEGNDGSIGEYGTASFQANIARDDASRSLAEEYSLAPLNTQKKYSAQSFDQQVENYFKQL